MTASLLIPLDGAPHDGAPHDGVPLDRAPTGRDAPFLRADDLGVLRGDGVFEALLVVDGKPLGLDDHLARLGRSAARIDLTVPPNEAWIRAITDAVARWPEGQEMTVRFIVTRGRESGGPPSAYLLADPVSPTVLRQRNDGIRVVTLDRGLDPALTERAPWLLMGVKVLSYAINMAALRWAQGHEADDAIFVAPDGTVLEGATSAVVVARGRQLVSPSTDLGILPSTTLHALFAAAPTAGWEVGYGRLTRDDLLHADAVWLLSSIRLAARIHTLDGQPLADPPAGSDTLDLLPLLA